MSKSMWQVLYNPTLGKEPYTIYRIRNTSEPMHSGNIEYFKDNSGNYVYFEDKEAANEYCRAVNEYEENS